MMSEALKHKARDCGPQVCFMVSSCNCGATEFLASNLRSGRGGFLRNFENEIRKIFCQICRHHCYLNFLSEVLTCGQLRNATCFEILLVFLCVCVFVCFLLHRTLVCLCLMHYEAFIFVFSVSPKIDKVCLSLQYAVQ